MYVICSACWSRALNQMGFTQTVPAETLYFTLHRLQSAPPATTTLQSGHEDQAASKIKPVLTPKERRRILLERVKADYASFPGGIPPSLQNI